MGFDVQLPAQALFLISIIWWSTFRVLAYIPYAIIKIFVRNILPWAHTPPTGANFYTGAIYHSRKRPKENTFTYTVRMACIDLDNPPSWWNRTTNDVMSADQARNLAGTSGPVRLLTHPPAAGYIQNPISVYYCYNKAAPTTKLDTKITTTNTSTNTKGNIKSINDDELEGCSLGKCISEVTNTPWGDRVTFVFRPTGIDGQGEVVPKALHVSPLMDMENIWRIKASNPGDKLFLSVAATHPQHGDYFIAALDARLDTSTPALPNELASFSTLLRYGFQPQRVAVWIYWQALVLLWKGVPFYGPPGQLACVAAQSKAQHPCTAQGKLFEWRPAAAWPWRVAS